MGVADRYAVLVVARDEIDRIESLWRALLAHHQQVADPIWPFRNPDESWRGRRQAYLDWMASGEGSLLLAVPAKDHGAEPGGYAFVRTRPAGETFAVGERVGELETLVVATHLRGQGIGSLLLEAVRQRLREERATYWSVTVVKGNDGADRLYERAGFRLYNRQMMAPLDDGRAVRPTGFEPVPAAPKAAALKPRVRR